MINFRKSCTVYVHFLTFVIMWFYFVFCFSCCCIPFFTQCAKDVAHMCPNCHREIGVFKRPLVESGGGSGGTYKRGANYDFHYGGPGDDYVPPSDDWKFLITNLWLSLDCQHSQSPPECVENYRKVRLDWMKSSRRCDCEKWMSWRGPAQTSMWH